MSVRAREGDVLSFRQYYMNNSRTDPVMGSRERLYAVVDDEGNFDIIEAATSPPVTKRMTNHLGINFSADGWALIPHEDVYEIVPPDQWPDEVCRYMAMRAMGVSTEGEE